MTKIVRRIRTRYKTVKAIAKMLLLTNDISRWKNVEKETYKWDERNKIIASHIPKGSSVLDIGAGAQTLRNYLSDYQYVPCDVVHRPGTLYCDINRNLYPQVNERFDYVICSGIIEYLLNPEEAILKLSGLGRYLIVSYACLRDGGIKEKRKRIIAGWRNHLTQKQLEKIFVKSRLAWEILGLYNSQIIYICYPYSKFTAIDSHSSVLVHREMENAPKNKTLFQPVSRF